MEQQNNLIRTEEKKKENAVNMPEILNEKAGKLNGYTT